MPHSHGMREKLTEKIEDLISVLFLPIVSIHSFIQRSDMEPTEYLNLSILHYLGSRPMYVITIQQAFTSLSSNRSVPAQCLEQRFDMGLGILRHHCRFCLEISGLRTIRSCDWLYMARISRGRQLDEL